VILVVLTDVAQESSLEVWNGSKYAADDLQSTSRDEESRPNSQS